MAQLGLNESADGTALSGMAYRYVGALGHLKVEVVNLTAPSVNDYFYSRLANPVGLLSGGTTDAAGNATVGCSLSGKTVTVSGIDAQVPTGNIGVIIFGF
jgi:hypothetical protein